MKNKKYPYYETPDVNNLRDVTAYCADAFGEKIAFSYFEGKKEVSFSYRDFHNHVISLSAYFISRGFSRKHIALIGENSYNWLVTYFAVVNSNNVIVPIDKELSPDDISLILEKSDSSLLVYSPTYEDEANEASKGIDLISMASLSQLIENGNEIISHGGKSCMDIELDNDNFCTIVFTSGTTATPKGVMLSHKNFVTDTVATSKSVRVCDPSLVTLPLHHTYGFVASITIPMLIGSSIFINSSIRRLMPEIKHSKPEYIAVVPLVAETIYKKIWENAKATGKDKLLRKMVKISDFLCKIGIDLRRKLFRSVIDGLGGNIQIIVIGGAPISPECVKGFYSFGIMALGGYGITECSPIVSTVRNTHYCPESVGSVHPGINVRIVDDEIQVSGETVFRGYYKDDLATSEAFDGEWFKTGDLGYLKDGFLFISGRKKNLIILGNGKNVSPEELEQKLSDSISEIDEIVVSEKNGVICAEIYANEADDATKAIVKNKVLEYNKTLPSYKHIAEVSFRDTEFPKTTTKKIKRGK
jgi:long-chain acyl-CoA synthetase